MGELKENEIVYCKLTPTGNIFKRIWMAIKSRNLGFIFGWRVGKEVVDISENLKVVMYDAEVKMKDRWKTNLSWFKKHTFGFLIGFFWGFWNKQSKIAPHLAGKREDMIARIARGLADISHRPYEECYADIKCEWDNFDRNGLKDWMRGEK